VIFIGFIALAIFILVGIPLGLSLLIFWIIKRNGSDKRWRLVAAVPILIVGYFIYTAIYPPESFYREDFKEVTGVDFPYDGQILYKTATYPDHFGDYESTSVVKLPKDFYNDLPDKLLINGLVQKNTLDQFDMDEVLEKFDGLTMQKEYSSETETPVVYYVGFLSDNETVIVRRSSW